MTVKTPSFIQDLCYTANDDRLILGGLVCGEGVASFDDLRVTQTLPTANNQVIVSAGHLFIRADQNSTNEEDGYYHVYNDADFPITIPNNASPLTYVVWARICDFQYTSVPSTGTLVLGSAGVTTEPSDDCTYYKLATIAAPASFTSISGEPEYFGDQDADITDNRSMYTLCGNAGTLREELVLTNTAGGTFDKASYPWLKSIRVRMVGGGGGGGGAGTVGVAGYISVGGGGGGGGYCERVFPVDEIPVGPNAWDVGTGGTGSTANAGGTDGGNTTFLGMTAGGGDKGVGVADAEFGNQVEGSAGGTATGGDINIPGSDGGGTTSARISGVSRSYGGAGGASQLGGTNGSFVGSADNTPGSVGKLYGGGGGGTAADNLAQNGTGGAGAAGVLIIELYG